MKKSQEISVDILKALENMHRRLSRIENKFLGALTDGNPDNSNDTQGGGNSLNPGAEHWQDGGNPSGPTAEQTKRIKDAFEFTYRQFFSDEQQIHIIPGYAHYSDLSYNPYRNPLADDLRTTYMNDALASSITVDVWLHEFDRLSRAKNYGQSNYKPTAGRVARDIVVRALIDKGWLSKGDTVRISKMEL